MQPDAPFAWWLLPEALARAAEGTAAAHPTTIAAVSRCGKRLTTQRVL
jgi:hypothetical protein